MAFFALPVEPAQAARIRAGQPALPIQELKQTQGLEAGRPLRLLDERHEFLATAVADPENELLRIWGRDEWQSLDQRFFRTRLIPALELRRRLGLVAPNAAYRLLHGEGESLPGLAIDMYGRFALITSYSRGLQILARTLAETLLQELPAQQIPLDGVIVRGRLKSKGKTPEKSKDEFFGETPPEQLVVEEQGLPCEVHLRAGTNTGLFLDMREHRHALARFVRGARVLNTFAYTGTLSVVAARAGAATVTSVDLAAGTLAWAQTNFRLAGLDPDAAHFRFIESDVFRYLEAAAKERTEFDVIVLDPPTVSGARASSWAQKKDYPDLIRAAVQLLPERGGHLWVSSNTHGSPQVLKHLQQAFAGLSRSAAVLEQGSLPPDHPTPLGAPISRYLEVVQVQVGPSS